MVRASSTFRQQDVTKAVKAVVAAGLRVAGVKVDLQTGKVEVAVAGSPTASGGDDLDRELADFEAQHAGDA